MQACAEMLGVSVEALRCAVPTYPPRDCKYRERNGCNNVALQNNYGSCAECRTGWFPVLPLSSSSSSSSTSPSRSFAKRAEKPPPGTLLLGPKFMSGVGMPNKLCSCEQPICISIGYPSEGQMSLPSDDNHRQQWFDAMNWNARATDTENPHL